ncbi:hypothetical protein [Prochlorococcus marinus]|uniref:hypothetical protein n=1 Tax=Prochlorococcus marinus TaxID=1219 RepID=UPI0022B5A3FD|nr:hypothetical protein [Prochlorococcus marinus]
MKYLLNKSFIIISLTPIILIFLISATNIQEKSKLKILLWETKEYSLGTLLAIGGLIGFSLSSLNNIILLYEINTHTSKTKSKLNINQSTAESYQHEDPIINESIQYFERDIREPSPTVSVPYKVIKDKNSQFKNVDLEQKDYTYTNKVNKDFSNITTQNDWMDIIDEKW